MKPRGLKPGAQVTLPIPIRQNEDGRYPVSHTTAHDHKPRRVTVSRSSDGQQAFATQMGPVALVPMWVLKHDLKPSELRTLISIRSFCGAGQTQPLARDIARRAGLSVGTVHNATQKLRDLGLIDTQELVNDDGATVGLAYIVFDIDPRLGAS